MYFPSDLKPYVQPASNAWNAAGSRFFFSYAGDTYIFPMQAPNDGISVVDLDYPTSPEAGGETVKYYDSQGWLRDADMIVSYPRWLNGDFSTYAPQPNKYDFQTVATHEFGHMAGQPDDYGAPNAVMYAYLYPGDIKLTLTTFDKNNLIMVYGPSQPYY